jgi:hypothetical protein
MKREQAVRINDHLVEACKAMDKARMAIAGLGKEERLKFGDLLHELVLDLDDKLLQLIYEQFPDLTPQDVHEDPPDISAELTWSEVRLPPSVTEADLDGIIFSLLTPRWQKVVMLLARAGKRCEELALPVSHEVIAARLKLLSDSDRIEGIGDLRMWRHSEVRLKDKSAN